MDFRKKFLVDSHVKFKLSNIDPAYKGAHESHETAVPELARHTASLAHLQYRLYAEGKRSLLIILQGLDAAGKDGVIRHVISGTNPQGVNVTCFKQPTHEELAHDFLWRAITATVLLRFWDMACSFVFGAPCQIRHWRGRSTAGPSH